MKYYLCIVGDFAGSTTIYRECVERGIYQYHEGTRQKGPVAAIESGDVLVLINQKQVMGYGIASSKAGTIALGHDEHWRTIQIQGGWRLADRAFGLPYGVYWNTICGTKQSIVKEIKPAWIVNILIQLKRSREETFSDRVFLINLQELATGRNSNPQFYVIPEIQRGLVWNPTRCEVLWDSIMRGVPIGAISVRRSMTREDNCCWEIFDGQQRSNAVSMGYSTFGEDVESPILWIDLDPPDNTYGRKFVFMVTTRAHPWGYELSSDEKSDNRLKTWEQREAVDKIDGAWINSGKKGERPYPKELWPVKARLPVPFTLLREFVNNNTTVTFEYFIAEYCVKYSNYNWMRCLIRDNIAKPKAWDEIVHAINSVLSEYAVVALNEGDVAESDLALYFKRMNKQGIEPDDEEIRYSMLKSKIPGLKDIDVIAKNRTRPSRLADLAVRFWLSKQEEWKWYPTTSREDISRVANNKDDFRQFIDSDFTELLSKLDDALMSCEGGDSLLKWHLCELYSRTHTDCLILYFMREIAMGRSTRWFAALATCILWFGINVQNCAKSLWESSCIQGGLFNAIQKGWLIRVFSKTEVENWAKGLKALLQSKEWGNGDKAIEDPFIGQALNCIWDGFHGGAGCSFLLFACRHFMVEYFDTYNPASSEWREQNRPWDYDHILPKNWVEGKRISGRSYLIKKFLWSIGNSAPLPFSMNRGKNAKAPDDYPDSSEKSAKDLHIICKDVNQFGIDRKGYSLLGHSEEASVHFISTTIDRIVQMISDWLDTCCIEELMAFSKYYDSRRILFESLQEKLDVYFGSTCKNASIWFTKGERQYPICKPFDWARPWLTCGICGYVQHEGGKKIRCMIGVASDGTRIEVGIRRHPEESEILDSEWWYSNKEGMAVVSFSDIAIVAEEVIWKKIDEMKNKYSFVLD